MNKQTCGTCRYFASGMRNEVGYCFANPPTPVLRAPLEPGDPDTVEWERPRVFSDDLGCRLWERVPWGGDGPHPYDELIPN